MTPSGIARDRKASSALSWCPRSSTKGAIRQAKVMTATTATATAI